jgi:hypothetical protein
LTEIVWREAEGEPTPPTLPQSLIPRYFRTLLRITPSAPKTAAKAAPVAATM